MDLSIIIPIHNTDDEKLRRCFDSICRIQEIQFECILVDDGSCADVGAFCQSYIKNDARFVYVWKENGGVSSARNMGIRMATGTFMCFVDSDDAIEPEAYNLPDLLNTDYDLIFTDLLEINGTEKTVWRAFSKPGEITYETAVKRKCYCGNLNGPYCKLIKKSFLNHADLWFNEDMIQGEDAVFFLEILKKKPVMQYRNIVSYYYFHSFSSSNQRFSKEPSRCIANLIQHYNSTRQAIQEGVFAEADKTVLTIKVQNAFVHGLFGRALDSLKFGVFSRDYQHAIQDALSVIGKNQLAKCDHMTKLKVRLLNTQHWVWLRMVVILRSVYHWAKGFQ